MELKEFITKWVAELESGNYLQTTEALCRANGDGTFGYCCLGVAAKVLDLEVQITDTDGFEATEGGNVNAQVYQTTKKLIGDCEQNHYIGMNDEGYANFSKIASQIRLDFKEFF